MKMILTAAIAACIAGCGSEAKDLSAAIQGFSKACDGTITAEFYAGSYNKALTLKCDKFSAKELK